MLQMARLQAESSQTIDQLQQEKKSIHVRFAELDTAVVTLSQKLGDSDTLCHEQVAQLERCFSTWLT